jgi:hypothetical protein
MPEQLKLLLNFEFLQRSFSLTQDLLTGLIDDCLDLEPYNQKSLVHWNKKISRLTSDVARFVEITTLLTKVLVTKGEEPLPQIKNSHIHLLFIMKGIENVRANGDMVALEDLIKHELKDNLTQWKIDIIPQLKKILI